MTIFIKCMGAFLLAIFSLSAQSQVLRCTEKMPPIKDDLLQRAMINLKLKHPSIGFQTDDEACRHLKDTKAALKQTLARDYLEKISGYEYGKLINGESYFTIERVKLRNPKDMQALTAALKKCQPCKLNIKANTSLAAFPVDGSILFIISSAIGREANSIMFQQVGQFFELNAETKIGK